MAYDRSKNLGGFLHPQRKKKPGKRALANAEKLQAPDTATPKKKRSDLPTGKMRFLYP